MRNKMENIKKAYEEILEVLNKHKDVVVFDVRDLEGKSKKHLFGIELKEKYGFNIDPKNINSLDWNTFGDYRKIGLFGEKHRRTISWEDNGKQPDDETLLYISFGTGAYIFGDDYPTKIFYDFFQELKSYNPKYIDSVNKGLYFSLDNAGKIFNDFPEIFKKHSEINKADSKQRKIDKLQKELEDLKK
jgi:hypothetical protein